ncbi:MAG: bifunctional diaminohydroxyphosphoribosylaminopyrimidine deaminase/5-amino-6-(5-phosphoribosylamino)uracil reductase RibD [Burkholderiales bacterium]|nr:bifunctional diaminohydroxyphosphoribosylaminopyrimidine deaminase/5-amino-6-(5-phosphoribosylamino)uracil reductase RibD [Burkholderiales bacterium]
MTRALELAALGLCTSSPNPRVGCVVVRDGAVAGEGWHERAGAPHAEVAALGAAGDRARGATVYVTLEPCAHHGRTPPCVDALLAARVARVVAAMRDPDPRSGEGLAILAARGIDAACGLMEAEARELNIGFVARHQRGRPWTRVKVAASLDGRTALGDGKSQWITGEAARRDGHGWRARSCAVLTGVGTVRADDPRLTVREVAAPRQPLRVVVDSGLLLPPSARVLEGGGVLVVAAGANEERERALKARGAEVIFLPGSGGRVDLGALLRELARREVNEVHVEAGRTLNGALVRDGLADELVLYLGAAIMGDAARGMFDLPAFSDLAGMRRVAIRDVRLIGADARVLARFV